MTDYIAYENRIYDITKINEKTTSWLLTVNQRSMKESLKNVIKLYRRWVELHDDKNYDPKEKAIQKTLRNLGLMHRLKSKDRLEQILLLALTQLEKGADLDLIKAILMQARDNSD